MLETLFVFQGKTCVTCTANTYNLAAARAVLKGLNEGRADRAGASKNQGLKRVFNALQGNVLTRCREGCVDFLGIVG